MRTAGSLVLVAARSDDDANVTPRSTADFCTTGVLFALAGMKNDPDGYATPFTVVGRSVRYTSAPAAQRRET